ncbi:hypothetical protein OUY22_24815 [Nonomuraea sp. MCN248]|uniref:Lipoprotein n=1 Tax=Nonomuraea corallina TaxID=2989783 RepID=A0ABT4SHF5_9ACTN|nr:hypothetical protein [Nonomuraea corallina]MDA0636647.1 hypothetical protein [Nonomuraea corallina]
MIRLLALGLVAVSVATGCTSAPPPQRPVVASVFDLVLPFDAYKPAPGQRALLDAAHRALVTHCLGRWTGPIPPAPPDPGNTRRYGVADPEQARRFGYHLPTTASPTTDPGGGARRVPAQERDHTEKERPRADDRRAGRPGSDRRRAANRSTGRSAKQERRGEGRRAGRSAREKAREKRRADRLRKERLYARLLRQCEGRAAERLGPTGRAPWRWLARHDARTLERAATTPEVRQAVTAWAACMRAAGHPYPSPQAAIADPRWSLDDPVISADEKRVAMADTACKWSSGLVAHWFTADAALQRKLVRKHAGRFALLRADVNERVQRAATLLARQGPTPADRD